MIGTVCAITRRHDDDDSKQLLLLVCDGPTVQRVHMTIQYL